MSETDFYKNYMSDKISAQEVDLIYTPILNEQVNIKVPVRVDILERDSVKYVRTNNFIMNNLVLGSTNNEYQHIEKLRYQPIARISTGPSSPLAFFRVMYPIYANLDSIFSKPNRFIGDDSPLRIYDSLVKGGSIGKDNMFLRNACYRELYVRDISSEEERFANLYLWLKHFANETRFLDPAVVESETERYRRKMGITMSMQDLCETLGVKMPPYTTLSATLRNLARIYRNDKIPSDPLESQFFEKDIYRAMHIPSLFSKDIDINDILTGKEISTKLPPGTIVLKRNI